MKRRRPFRTGDRCIVGAVERVNKNECIVVGVVLRGGRILIQQRVGDPGMDGLWELPGGRVGLGEKHTTALRREIAEETGLEVKVSGLLVAMSHTYPDRRVTLFAYGCTLVGDRQAAKPTASDSGPRWVTPGASYAGREPSDPRGARLVGSTRASG